MQEAMDTAHTRWSSGDLKGKPYTDFIGALPIPDQYVVSIGHMNYQVTNGGWAQWIDNRYHLRADVLKSGLAIVNTAASKRALSILCSVLSKYQKHQNNRFYGQFVNWTCDDCGDYDAMVDSIEPECDEYYAINLELLDDVEAFLLQVPNAS